MRVLKELPKKTVTFLKGCGWRLEKSRRAPFGAIFGRIQPSFIMVICCNQDFELHAKDGARFRNLNPKKPPPARFAGVNGLGMHILALFCLRISQLRLASHWQTRWKHWQMASPGGGRHARLIWAQFDSTWTGHRLLSDATGTIWNPSRPIPAASVPAFELPLSDFEILRSKNTETQSRVGATRLWVHDVRWFHFVFAVRNTRSDSWRQSLIARVPALERPVSDLELPCCVSIVFLYGAHNHYHYYYFYMTPTSFLKNSKRVLHSGLSHLV